MQRNHVVNAALLSAAARWVFAAVSLTATLRAQSGTIRGTVVDARTGRGLPYSAVAAGSTERFTTDSGRFVLTRLDSKRVQLRVRHVGYVPLDTTVSFDAAPALELRLELRPLAVTLTTIRVDAARSCTTPGAPRPDVDSVLAATFQQLQQNAQQYRLITQRYPFESTVRQEFWFDSPSGPAEVRQRVAKVRSDGGDSYDPGHAIVDHGLTRAVVIPTLAIFTDRDFVEAHCFRAGGMDVQEGDSLARIDFQVADRIKGPDLDGSIYLDPKTFVIRRSHVGVSKLTDDLSEFDSISVDTRFEEIVPGVPIVSEAHGRSHYAHPRESRTGMRARAYVEHQRDVQLEFLRGQPGDSGSAGAKRRIRRPDRILGLFDADSGVPVVGAEVRDPRSGATAVTTVTGTVSLAFVQASRGAVLIRAAGYEPTQVNIKLSFADTVPMTVLLRRKSP